MESLSIGELSFKVIQNSSTIDSDIELINQCGIIDIDAKKESILLSKGTLKLLGIQDRLESIDLIGLFENVDKDDRDALISLFELLFIRDKRIKLDVRITHDTEESKETKYIQVRADKLSNKHIGVLLIDITDNIRKIHDLQRKTQKAEEADRMKTTFLSNISHELRTPMNAILGFSELINIGNLSEESRREYTSIIKRKGRYLLTLLDDIVEISKYEAGTLSIKKTECNVEEILEEVFIIYDERRIQTGKSHIEFKLVHPKEKIGLINTDPGRLLQVLSNLLSNALTYTDKGSIEFGVKTPHEKTLQFYFKDTGSGLTKEEQKYLFHRFRNVEEMSSKKAGETGLKLTISKAIVELLGGKIWVDSAPNEGSTFYFTIPYTHNVIEEEDLSNKEVSQSFNWKDSVILVVEDEEDNYTFIEAILHDTQVQLIHAINGKQAVELCKSINKIDLVLMDIKMPEKSGYDATREILKMRPGLPVIAQTAFSMKEDRDKCIKAGCVDYITKPFDVDIFINMINTYLPG
ncbi:MAG: response regulator [Bacteroidales bacterium]|nr:response regulator [Bacteroidales bacterium]